MVDESSPDAYRATGAEVRPPPSIVRTFTRDAAQSRAEFEAEPIAAEIVTLFRSHGIPVTSELDAAVGDLALAAILTRDHSASDRP